MEQISQKDRNILRDLAKRQMEIANSQQEETLKKGMECGTTPFSPAVL